MQSFDGRNIVVAAEVLVIDAGGCLGAAVTVDMFIRRIKERGAFGLVVDGVCELSPRSARWG